MQLPFQTWRIFFETPCVVHCRCPRATPGAPFARKSSNPHFRPWRKRCWAPERPGRPPCGAGSRLHFPTSLILHAGGVPGRSSGPQNRAPRTRGALPDPKTHPPERLVPGERAPGHGRSFKITNSTLRGSILSKKKIAPKAPPRRHFSSTPGAAAAWKRLQSDPGLA